MREQCAGGEFAQARIEGSQLSPVTVRQQQLLHIGDLIRPDEAETQRIVPVPQIDIEGPILVGRAQAIQLQPGQRLPDRVAGAAQGSTGDAQHATATGEPQEP